jgi:hypothetical protein
MRSVVKHLRKFTSAHQELLNWAVFQALQLKRVPANIRQQALIVELDYHPNAPDSLHWYASLAILTDLLFAHGFTLNLASPSREPTSFLGHTSPGPMPMLPLIFSDETTGAGGSGGIGAAVVSIQCGGLSQVMPVEVDPPSQITWDSRDDWSEVARHFVNSGRTDFKPISSTSRGSVYILSPVHLTFLLTLLPELSTDDSPHYRELSRAGNPNRTSSASIISHLIHHDSPLVQGRSH